MEHGLSTSNAPVLPYPKVSGATARASLLRISAPAIADQAAFAGTHLLLNVVLARSLPPAEYGVFTLAYALFLIGDAFHHALLAEPLLVLSRRVFADRFAGYLGAVFLGFAVLSGVFGIVLGAVALLVGVAGSPELRLGLLAIAAANPFLLLVLLMRRVCHARFAPEIAASGGILYALVTGAGLTLFYELHSLSVVSAVAIMAFASLASALWIAFQLRLSPQQIPDRDLLREVVREHWAYGRWATVASVAKWIPWNLHYVILSVALTLEGIAGIRAVYTILLPLHHLIAATAMCVLPILSAQLASGQPARARTTALQLAALYAGAGLAYTGLIFVFGQQILLWIYGDTYAAVYPLAVYVAAIEVPVGGAVVMGLLMRATGRSDRSLIAHVPYAILSLLFGGVGALKWGAAGLIFGILIASIVATLGAGVRFRHWVPWRSPEPRIRETLELRTLRSSVSFTDGP